MTIRITCPSCDKSYNVDDTMRGKKVRCRNCQGVVPVPADDEPASAGIKQGKPAPVAARPSKPAKDETDEEERPRSKRRIEDEDDDERPRRRREVDEEEDEEDEDRPRKRKKKKAGSMLPLLIGGGVGAVVLIGVILFFVVKGGSAKNQVAQAKPAPNVGNPQPPPVQPAPAPPQQAPPQQAPQQQQPPQPQQVPPPQQAQAGPGGADDAGVDDLGEKVLPADKAPGDAPLRHLKGAALYKLSNLRVGTGPGAREQIIVHYERVSGDDRTPLPTLVLRSADGNESSVTLLTGPFQSKRKADDITVSLIGIRAKVPQDLEVYFVHTDRRWEGENFKPRFKVSNSVTIGNMGRPIQYARAWNAAEATKLSNPPPEAPRANENKNVGADTAFVGNTEGLLPPLRYADPEKRPVLGVMFRTGTKEADKGGPKIKCLAQMSPVYDARQPRFGQEMVIAKDGYALGGLNVKTKRIVTAVQIVFMKKKADGTLDATDTYTSSWLGHPESADADGTLSGNGRKVIGMFLKTFGAVNAVALVLD